MDMQASVKYRYKIQAPPRVTHFKFAIAAIHYARYRRTIFGLDLQGPFYGLATPGSKTA